MCQIVQKVGEKDGIGRSYFEMHPSTRGDRATIVNIVGGMKRGYEKFLGVRYGM